MDNDKVPWILRHSSIYKDPFLKKLIDIYYTSDEKKKKNWQNFKDVILRILNIYLEGKDVEDILISWGEVKTINYDATLEDLEDEIKRSKHSRYPVIEKETGEIKGILHVKDLLTKSDFVAENGWQEILRKAYYVSVDVKLFDALAKMRATRSHLLLIIDPASEGIEGIVTMEDIIEQIFGDISDEFDTEREKEKYILKISGYEIWLRGDTPLDVAEKRLPCFSIDKEMEEKVDSLAGLVIALNDFIVPEVGTRVDYGDWSFTVEKINASKIEIIKARRKTNK